MQHIYICPECRYEHAEPANAHFVCEVLCLDCDLDLELRARPDSDERILEAA